jgi:LytS/YehU family sensor histidine kinase
MPVTLAYASFSLSVWYLVRAMPLTTVPVLRLVGVHLVGALVSSMALVLVLQGWAFLLRGFFRWSVAINAADLRLLFGGGVLLYLLAAATHYLLAAFETSLEAERRSFEAQLLARDSELKALRAQIDPHFLFNSLNSISALTAVDPGAARTMTERLAGFFRASVAAGRQPLATLEAELGLARQYLEIEQVRFGARLAVAMDVDPELRNRRIPSLLLQPIVENAVKHGIAGTIDGGCVRIDARLRGSQMHIRVTNPVDAERHHSGGTSFGLEAVRSRLRATAPGEAGLDARHEAGLFVVDLILPSDL